VRTLIDARKRFLTPGGAMVGRRDTLWAVVVEAPDLYRTHFAGWNESTLAFDQDAGRQIMANSWYPGKAEPKQFITEPRCWATLDYETVLSPDLTGDVVWTAARTGTAHGLVVWFDAELTEGVGFSNAPGKPDAVYGRAFFPWPEPVAVETGDVIDVRLEARLFGENDYVWNWISRISGPSGSRADFRQTSLLGEAVSPAILRRRAAQYKPALGEEGQVDQFILSAMDGRTALSTIARRLRTRFPDRFASLKTAIVRVGQLSERYSN
jgi:protein arginine N-methyltransferase 1